MIKSMTGFGKYILELPNGKFIFEIKSLNSRQLDLSVKLPPLFREMELELRTVLAPLLQRGKVESVLIVEMERKIMSSTICKSAVAHYLSELKSISNEQNLLETDLLPIVMRLPDVLNTETPSLDEDTWKHVLDAALKAVEKFGEFRLHEGQILEKDFRMRIAQIKNLLKNIEPYEKQRIEKIRETLQTNLERWVDVSVIDKNRFEQELFFYLEKLDITEEKVRLEKHCDYFLGTLDEEAAGKKLGFIAQEIGREINTIGSKANDVDIQKIVVEMKDELEKVKEQLMNVL